MWFARRGCDSNLARYEYYCSWKNCLQSAYASIHSETHTWGKLECRLNNLVCACADIETCARSHLSRDAVCVCCMQYMHANVFQKNTATEIGAIHAVITAQDQLNVSTSIYQRVGRLSM